MEVNELGHLHLQHKGSTPTHILRSAPCARKQHNHWDVDQAATGNMAGAEQAQVETQPLPPG